MEQWRNGRRELFEQLNKVCNNIEQNLTDELVDGDNTIIRKDELERLRLKAETSETDNDKYAAQVRSNEDSIQEKDLRIKVLEEDISRLKEGLQLNGDAASLTNRLEEENISLTKELTKYQKVALKVEDLEQQNKNLSTGLRNAVTRAKDAELPSTDNERSSSFGNGHSPSVGCQLNYKELLNEHKRVKEQWLMQKERADNLAETQREKNVKLRQWQAWSDEQHILFKNKADKSNAQAQEIRKLRLRLQELEGGKATTPGTMLSSDPGDSALPPRPEEIPVTRPTKSSQVEENNRQSGQDESEHEQGCNEQANLESPKLPRYGRRLQHVTSVEETQFLPIEPCHSSSTQDPESSLFGGGESATVSEPKLETPKMPSSDDPPEFISARPVRKRKRNERESQRTPMPKVKVESLDSSSPIISRILHASESLDLDDIGDKVITPRKRRRAFEPSVEDVENEVENEVADEMLLDDNMERKKQAPTPVKTVQPTRAMITPASKRGKIQVSTPLRSLSTNNRILPNKVDLKLPVKRQLKSSVMIRGVEEILEDEQSTNLAKTHASVGKGRIPSVDLVDNLPPTEVMSYPTPQSAAPEVRSVILPPSKLSTVIMTNRLDRLDQRKNVNNAPRFPNHREDLDRQDIKTPVLEKGVSVSNVENDIVRNAISRPRIGLRNEISRPERLLSLNNGVDETVERPNSRFRTGIMKEISRPSLKGSRRGSTASAELSPARATKAFWESTRSPVKSTPKAKSGTSKPSTTTKIRPKRVGGPDPDSDDPEQEPYRLRSVTMLKLDHFKINPNFNQGYDYAYTEVVRGKDRQCLPGCVREKCCGKQFGALAQALYPVRDNPTNSQKAGEDSLLEDYLGDNKHKIWSMGKLERKETLAQARKWKLSNKTGKHRSVVARRITPPGFWDPDFPNTQEDEELRKKQKELEREKVAERYAEAMRPGGAWLFKDE
ncbi:hypothetical protein SBOR_5533 [Sclerotinia borealis F-4128]|uniref:DNA endonuclease activator Ctp1 C-terminal domain-containing protein n=1 Tax=Sclerotinia borealis (strain F-4128) TaxID=1432307 RepID=W9CBC3_SCLBF|nr:hypothetical protein SBOR_5533 [Sclerotinia borealis F-4128]